MKNKRTKTRLTEVLSQRDRLLNQKTEEEQPPPDMESTLNETENLINTLNTIKKTTKKKTSK